MRIRRDNAIHNISISGSDIDPLAAVWRRCCRDFVTDVTVAGFRVDRVFELDDQALPTGTDGFWHVELVEGSMPQYAMVFKKREPV